MERAAKAFLTWRTDEAARRSALMKCGEGRQARAAEAAEVRTREQGSPLANGPDEASGAAVWF